MNDNVSWVFQNQDLVQPQLCSQCGEVLSVTWLGDTYDYACVNLACTQLYFGPPYTEAELASDAMSELGSANCPRCLMPMNVVPNSDGYAFACLQDGCDGIWPPVAH